MKKQLSGMVLAALAMSACATRPYNHIDASARSHLTSLDSVLIITQSEIAFSINESNVAEAMGGGLIPALLDSAVNNARAKSAEKRVASVRDKLIDFDIATQFEKDLEAEIADANLPSVEDVELVRAINSGFRAERIIRTSADAVLFVTTKMEMSPNFDQIVLRSSVSVYPNNPALIPYKEKVEDDSVVDELTDNIYRNSFVQIVPLASGPSPDENIEQIVALDTDELIGMLEQASADLAHVIVEDLQVDDALPNE